MREHIVINCMNDLCVAHMRPGQTYNKRCKGKPNSTALLLHIIYVYSPNITTIITLNKSSIDEQSRKYVYNFPHFRIKSLTVSIALFFL